MENKPARFDRFLKRAEAIVKSPERVQRLTGQAIGKLTKQGTDGLRQAQAQIKTAIAMINAWRLGDYQGLSTKTIISLVAALLYFVVPLDVIPDFLLGWGFIDDMAVMGYVFNQLNEEVEEFKAWQLAETGDELESQAPHSLSSTTTPDDPPT